MGFVFHHEIEWKLISDGMRAVVMCEFGVGNRFQSGCGIIAAEHAKVGFYLLIYSFCFAVGLRMVSGREGEVIVQEFSEFASEGGGELRSLVRDDFVKKSKAEENFAEEKGGNSFGGNSFGRAKNHPLGKPMVYHDQERIKA